MIKNSYIASAENDLAYLTDFYFDARYPGDDFYTVSKEEFDKCLSVMYDTVRKLQGIG